MLERLQQNLGLKVLSLLLAIAGWAYLRFAANPIVAARFDQQLSVPIVTTGLRLDQVARLAEKQAVVTVIGPRGGSAAIKPDDVRAVVDLEGRGPGVYNVAVQVIAPRLELKSLAPASVTLTVERLEERTVPIAIRYAGELAGTVVESATTTPSAAHLRGPTSDLARVSRVRVDVPIPTGDAVDAMLRPVAGDEAGALVGAVTVAPELVRVQAHFLHSHKVK